MFNGASRAADAATHLTAKGREVERIAEETLQRLEEEMAARLGAERMAALQELLEELDAALKC